MSAHALVWWVAAAALLTVLIAAAVRMRRALGELKRATARVDALQDAPLFHAAERLQRAQIRLEAAAAAIVALLERARVAVERMRADVATLRALLGR